MSKTPEAKKRQTCRKKKTYETTIDASIAVAVYWLNYKTMSDVYECEVCNKYHLTTRR